MKMCNIRAKNGSMRLFVQIVAIFAFMLATSQFSHGHETASALTPHVHGHNNASTDHHDDMPVQSGHDSAVHCGAHLLPLTSEIAMAFPRAYSTYSVPEPKARNAIHSNFDPPPPRS